MYKEMPENVSINESIRKQEEFSILLMQNHQQPTTLSFYIYNVFYKLHKEVLRKSNISTRSKKGGLCMLQLPRKLNGMHQQLLLNPFCWSYYPRARTWLHQHLFSPPEAHFTNRESLPSSIYAFSNFVATNPRYTSTETTDHIRDHDYCHLSNQYLLWLHWRWPLLPFRVELRSSVLSFTT